MRFSHDVLPNFKLLGYKIYAILSFNTSRPITDFWLVGNVINEYVFRVHLHVYFNLNESEMEY